MIARALALAVVALAACHGGPEPGTITLTAYPVRVLADGREPTTLTATVRDPNDNPLAHATVALHVSGSDNTLGVVTGVTDADGVLVPPLRSHAGETKMVTATTGDRSATHGVTFMPLPPCAGVPRIGTALDFGGGLETIGNFNGDRNLDAIVLTGELLLGAGDGTFAGESPTNINVLGPWFAQAADLDHDGHDDVVTSSWAGPNITLYMGNGDGTFRAPVQLPVAGRSDNTSIADFDGDGHDDIVATTNSEDLTTVTISVLFGHGDGMYDPYVDVASFSSGEMGSASSGSGIAMRQLTGDLDGDGRVDLVTWEQNTTTIHVYYGNANRTFTETTLASSIPLHEHMSPSATSTATRVRTSCSRPPIPTLRSCSVVPTERSRPFRRPRGH